MRKSGILMHISSLPGPYGIGAMGKHAREFVDFLSAAGQSFWQVLPLNPTGFGNSPYQSVSTFAGNPYFVDLDALAEEGLLLPEELDEPDWGQDAGRVDFLTQYLHKNRLLRLACSRFVPDGEYQAFAEENRHWLDDYCLFLALKDRFDGAPWQEWPEGLRRREPAELEHYRTLCAKEMDVYRFAQYQFFRQWSALRKYAGEKGVSIIGDVPIYVPLDSADVWANPQLFLLDEELRPTMVAGCPPDGFSADGQLWGNPLYRWDKMRQTGYSWWISRLSAAFKMYDVVRLDHFRGFESFWAVPAEDETAAGGHWEQGPGMDLIRAVKNALPQGRFIAEDLGFLTPEVRQLLADSGFPGMKIMQFAFDAREVSDYLPHAYPEHSVCYPGTHDNLTMVQWFREASEEDVAFAVAYLGLHEEEGFVRGVIRGCMSSVSQLCVVQMQDHLELGGEARMNEPGTCVPENWTWRAPEDDFTGDLAQRIYDMTRRYARL